jgi:hypothetical protein
VPEQRHIARDAIEPGDEFQFIAGADSAIPQVPILVAR